MARKLNESRRKIGYILTIKHEAGFKKGEWERVGFVEPTRELVHKYRQSNYPTIKTYTVTGVRVNSTPIIEDNKQSERKGVRL